MAIELVFTQDPDIIFMGGACASPSDEIVFSDIQIDGPVRDVVVMHRDLAAVLSKYEIKAVLAHEESHIVRKHAEKMTDKNTVMINNTRVAVFYDEELEADADAAAAAGASTMTSALTKVIDWMFGDNDMTRAVYAKQPDAAAAMLQNAKVDTFKSLDYRFEALRNL